MFFKGESRDVVLNYPRMEKGGGRIWELDFLRGLMIILMCIDHFMFDLSEIFYDTWIAEGGAAAAVARFAECWWDHGATWIGRTRDIVQVIALCVFFGLCGGSTIFSRDNLSRAIKTFLAAAVITLGTFLAVRLDIIDGENLITFGVLHMLSFATLIVSSVYAVTRLFGKRGDLVFFILSLLFAGGIFLADHLISAANVSPNPWLMFLHFDFCDFYGGDYFALIPYLGYAFVGAAVVTLLYGGGKSLLPKADGAWNRPFRFVGKHTLLVVIIHQVVNILLLSLVTAAFVDVGNFVIF